MKHNIDTLKIHTLTTQLNHHDYMAYRKAIQSTRLSSAAFLRCLVTIGLVEVTPIVNKSQQKAQLKKEMAALQTKMDALNALSGSNLTIPVGPTPQVAKVKMTPTGRFPKGERLKLVQAFVSIRPNASPSDIQGHLSIAKGRPVSIATVYKTIADLSIRRK